jgi:hypothetical protein
LDVRQTKENQTEEAVQKIAHGRVLIFVPWLLPKKGEGHELREEGREKTSRETEEDDARAGGGDPIYKLTRPSTTQST